MTLNHSICIPTVHFPFGMVCTVGYKIFNSLMSCTTPVLFCENLIF